MLGKENFKNGSIEGFNRNWNKRNESHYIHWTRVSPDNQIRLAFYNHFKLFRDLEKKSKETNKKFIEIGAGRGSLSAYYAQNNYDVTLLDTSQEIINIAKKIFKLNKLKANFIVSNAEDTGIKSDTYDIVASIGLLEHFNDPNKIFKESIRIAKSNADIYFYVVPEKEIFIQKIFDKINNFLAIINNEQKRLKKDEIFRSTYDIKFYKNILVKYDSISNINSFGVYPLPMISPNRDFPFTLNSKILEILITRIFSIVLNLRFIFLRRNPWICREENGQAFLLHFRKK